MNPDIRNATADELRRFDTAFHALVPSPGFQGLSVTMALKFPKVGCEPVNFGGFISAMESIPVMERLVTRIGRSGKVAIHHTPHAYAELNRQLAELKAKQASIKEERDRELLADLLARDDLTDDQRKTFTDQLATL